MIVASRALSLIVAMEAYMRMFLCKVRAIFTKVAKSFILDVCKLGFLSHSGKTKYFSITMLSKLV